MPKYNVFQQFFYHFLHWQKKINKKGLGHLAVRRSVLKFYSKLKSYQTNYT